MATGLGKFVKQPAETLDYDVVFTEWFVGRADAIASHVASATPGLNIVSSAVIGSVVRLVISGGEAGQSYKVTVRVTTTASPPIIKEADFTIQVKEV
jgi:hypothetical protein